MLRCARGTGGIDEQDRQSPISMGHILVNQQKGLVLRVASLAGGELNHRTQAPCPAKVANFTLLEIAAINQGIWHK